MRQVVSSEERHEGGGKRQEALIERLQRGFSTQNISDEDDDKE